MIHLLGLLHFAATTMRDPFPHRAPTPITPVAPPDKRLDVTWINAPAPLGGAGGGFILWDISILIIIIHVEGHIIHPPPSSEPERSPGAPAVPTVPAHRRPLYLKERLQRFGGKAPPLARRPAGRPTRAPVLRSSRLSLIPPVSSPFASGPGLGH